MPKQKLIPIEEPLDENGEFEGVHESVFLSNLVNVGWVSKELTKRGHREERVMLPSLFEFEGLRTRLDGVEKEIAEIRTIIRETHHVETPGDKIYAKFRDSLEEEKMGKIAAIDLESGTIAGVGDTAAEAFHIAKEKTGRSKFAFKRIGSKYVYSI
jgi:hypothetical protein